jgi:hypothetical protein
VKTYIRQKVGIISSPLPNRYHLHHKRPQIHVQTRKSGEVVETSEVFFPPRWLACSDYLSAAAAALSFLLPSLDGKKIQQQLLDVDAKAV